MAYTLTDPFSTLRSVLRLSGTMFLILGLLMTILPARVLAEWGSSLTGPTWPVRLAGVLMLTLAMLFIMAASERLISIPAMTACSVGNALMAVTLLVAYLQRELASPTIVGLIALVVVFIICLVGAVMPLRYLRAEYRTD
jgi:drug/metabolite transporter (DMT)-like permease